MINRKQQKIIFYSVIGFTAILMLGVVLFVMNKNKMVKYVSYKNGFSVKYPKDWKVLEEYENIDQLMAIFASPKDNELDTYIENVTVVKQDLKATQSQQLTLKQYTDLAIKQMEAVFEDNLITLESRPIKLNGRPAYRYVFMGKQQQSDDVMIKNLAVWTVDGNTAFQLMYTSQEFNYKLHEREAERLIRSFKIL